MLYSHREGDTCTHTMKRIEHQIRKHKTTKQRPHLQLTNKTINKENKNYNQYFYKILPTRNIVNSINC